MTDVTTIPTGATQERRDFNRDGKRTISIQPSDAAPLGLSPIPDTSAWDAQGIRLFVRVPPHFAIHASLKGQSRTELIDVSGELLRVQGVVEAVRSRFQGRPSTDNWNEIFHCRDALRRERSIPDDRALTYRGLSDQARTSLMAAKQTRLARLLEDLHRAGFASGRLTLAEAGIHLPHWKEATLRRALDDLQAFMATHIACGCAGSHDYSANSPSLLSGGADAKLQENAPKSRGRPAKAYLVPPLSAIDRLFGHPAELRYHEFETGALVSNRQWRAHVAKIRWVGARRVRCKLWREAKRLKVSRCTLGRLHKLVGVEHRPWYDDVPLPPGLIADAPRTRGDLVRALRSHQVRSKWVHDASGEQRLFCLDSILGKCPSRARALRTGASGGLPPLSGQLYQTIRVGTEITDMGGFVYTVQAGQRPEFSRVREPARPLGGVDFIPDQGCTVQITESSTAHRAACVEGLL